jgi:acetylornithine deacetylase
VAGAPGERQLSLALADLLAAWGLDVRLQDAAPGRPNVVATLRGRGRGRSLMFNGHIDVVDTEGMTHAPFEALERSGRVFGRGASDMKGGVAAMCAAAERLKGELRGDLIVAAVVDEEFQSAGTASLLASGVRTDAAIVTEPTKLQIMPAHKGFVWIEVIVRGRAAHGSRWDIGIDAIRHAGLVLAELDRLDAEELTRRTHSLLGRASLHASEIEGGIGLSTYPDRCVIRLERRTLPGEEVAAVVREVEDACSRVRARRPAFDADVRMMFAQPPSEVAPGAPIVRALEDILADRRLPATLSGMSAWTDAALLNQAGIPAVCFGPGDMGLAHAAEEYIEVGEIERATDVLAALGRKWCN